MSLALGVPAHGLSQIVGLDPDGIGSPLEFETQEIQRRLRDMMEILARVEADVGGVQHNLAW